MLGRVMLESEDAARRLGVRLPTLYAYVSRGLLHSVRAPGGRRSLFDADEVEQLARRARGSKKVETRLVTITTSVTQIREDAGPLYRGRAATGLAGSASFEEVAALLWATGEEGPQPWPLPDPGRPRAAGAERTPTGPGPSPARPARRALFGVDDPVHRLQQVVLDVGTRDALRSNSSAGAVTAAARRVIVAGAAAFGGVAGPVPPLLLGDRTVEDSVAGRVAAGLTARPGKDLVRTVNAVLVLLADHELATSTLAVRLAASTRADVYDALLAGLSALAGPLHGGASDQCYALLEDATRRSPEEALDEALRRWGRVPGFGHSVYRSCDPRFDTLLELFDRVAPPRPRRTVRALLELADAHGIITPNIDLGLAAVAFATRMERRAGQALFALARVAGWTAHYLEELSEPPLRFRARAVYASPA